MIKIDERLLLLLSINSEYKVNAKTEISIEKIYEILNKIIFFLNGDLYISRDKEQISGWAKFYKLDVKNELIICDPNNIEYLISYLDKVDDYYKNLFIDANKMLKNKTQELKQ